MPFRSGTVAYASFAVTGGPAEVDRPLLDAMSEHVVQPPPVGAPPELQAGWTGGRHVYDHDFDADEICFGDTMLFGLRLDTNRVPAELRRAHRAVAEAARASGSATGFLSRGEQREAKQEAEDRCREELAAGRHRRSKLLPVWWRVGDRRVHAPVFGDASSSALRDLFETTFDATLEPLGAGALARFARRGSQRDLEDARPTPFSAPPAAAAGDGGDATVPPVPWSFAGPERTDFLGNEFLLWLWARTETDSAVLSTPAGEVAVAIDRALDMQCAWDVTGTQALRAGGPTRLPEARAALRIGKWPRKAGLVLAATGEQWSLTLQADRFLVTGLALPRPEDPPASPREAIEGRLSSVAALDRALVGLYAAFLEERLGDGWSGTRERMRGWVRKGARGAGSEAPVDLVEVG